MGNSDEQNLLNYEGMNKGILENVIFSVSMFPSWL